MGRGDSRTKRGKIFKASYGNSRKHRVPGAAIASKKTGAATPKKTTTTKKSK